jgi:hypothetical protein
LSCYPGCEALLFPLLFACLLATTIIPGNCGRLWESNMPIWRYPLPFLSSCVIGIQRNSGFLLDVHTPDTLLLKRLVVADSPPDLLLGPELRYLVFQKDTD